MNNRQKGFVGAILFFISIWLFSVAESIEALGGIGMILGFGVGLFALYMMLVGWSMGVSPDDEDDSLL